MFNKDLSSHCAFIALTLWRVVI